MWRAASQEIDQECECVSSGLIKNGCETLRCLLSLTTPPPDPPLRNRQGWDASEQTHSTLTTFCCCHHLQESRNPRQEFLVKSQLGIPHALSFPKPIYFILFYFPQILDRAAPQTERLPAALHVLPSRGLKIIPELRSTRGTLGVCSTESPVFWALEAPRLLTSCSSSTLGL